MSEDASVVETKVTARFAPGKRRLTADQFDVLLPHLSRLSAKRIEAARMALVDNLTLSSIAARFGWSSRQNVSDAVDSVFAARTRYEESQRTACESRGMKPPGWEAVTLIAPPEFITRWRKELANEFGKVQAMEHKTQVSSAKPRKRKSALEADAFRDLR